MRRTGCSWPGRNRLWESKDGSLPGFSWPTPPPAGSNQTERQQAGSAILSPILSPSRAETDAISLPRTHLFRPGYIYPVTPRTEPNLSYRAFRALWPALRLAYPNVGISSDGLAQAMLLAGLNGTAGHDSPVLENRDIRRLAAENR